MRKQIENTIINHLENNDNVESAKITESILNEDGILYLDIDIFEKGIINSINIIEIIDVHD